MQKTKVMIGIGKAIKMDQNNNSIPSPEDILRMAGENKPIDRSQLGIDTHRSSDGLEIINEGFDFLQHGNDGGTHFGNGN